MTDTVAIVEYLNKIAPHSKAQMIRRLVHRQQALHRTERAAYLERSQSLTDANGAGGGAGAGASGAVEMPPIKPEDLSATLSPASQQVREQAQAQADFVLRAGAGAGAAASAPAAAGLRTPERTRAPPGEGEGEDQPLFTTEIVVPRGAKGGDTITVPSPSLRDIHGKGGRTRARTGTGASATRTSFSLPLDVVPGETLQVHARMQDKQVITWASRPGAQQEKKGEWVV